MKTISPQERGAIRAEAIDAAPQIIAAVLDTCEFMTGSRPIESDLDQLRQNIQEASPEIPWSVKHTRLTTIKDDLDAISQLVFNRRMHSYDPEFCAAIAEGTQLPPSNPFYTELISWLGGRILETAYQAVGDDVEERIEEGRTVLALDISDEEKADKISAIVLESMKSLVDDHDNESEKLLTGSKINHILKLSPQHVGPNSDLKLKPTCLSFSIIAASMLRKIGVERISHAGVITPKVFSYASILEFTARDVVSGMPLNAYPFPDQLRQSMERLQQRNRNLAENWDPHSCVIFTVGDATTLLDPYQLMNIGLSETDSTRMQSVQELTDKYRTAEITHIPSPLMVHEYRSAVMQYGYERIRKNMPSAPSWVKALDYSIMSGDVQPLYQLLERGYKTESLGGYIELIMAAGVIDPFIEEYANDSLEHGYELTEAEIYRLSHTMARNLVMNSLASHVFRISLKKGDTFEACLARCEKDDRYRERVAEDLFNWPWRMFLNAIQDVAYYGDNYGVESHPHTALEVGNLDHRVGACSLLDVSYGLGQDLPMSFWATQTSSQLPWLYSEQARKAETESQVGKMAMAVVRSYLQVEPYRYRQIAALIV